jgi:hypothetical protein
MLALEAYNIVIGLTCLNGLQVGVCLNGLQVGVYIQQKVAFEPMKQQEFWLRTVMFHLGIRYLLFASSWSEAPSARPT